MSTVAPEVEVDLFSDEVLYDPYPTYRRLREEGAAVYLPQNDLWAVSRYDDVRAGLADWELFSSTSGTHYNDVTNEIHKHSVLFAHPPLHSQLREPLNTFLGPKAIRGLADDIRASAEQLVESLVERGSFDAVTDLARVFPVNVIVDMIGLPDSARDSLYSWSDATFMTAGPINDRWNDGMARLTEAIEYMSKLTQDDFTPGQLGWEMFEVYKQNPAPDAQEVLIGHLGNLTLPSTDTTISTIGHAIWRFAQHPDQWRRLREDRSLLQSAVFEVLRMDAPLPSFSRVLSRDTVVGDVEVPEGARAVMMYASGNRDERHYVDPDEFRVDRNAVDHLSFGYGIHSCVGQRLARLEIESLINALADRVVEIEADDPSHLEHPIRHLNQGTRSLESLPVTVKVA